jgi:hypothetical protein
MHMMTNKYLSITVMIVSLLALLAVFAMAGAAQSNNTVYLPAIHSVTGGEPSTPTPTPEPRHFESCAFATGDNATIGVKTDLAIDGGLVLEAGDEIAIFTPDGSICAGMEPWSGKNIAITAWGDDTITEEIDGLRSGEEMAFRIWDESENKEIAVSEVEYSYGNGIYSIDGIYIVSSFTLQ